MSGGGGALAPTASRQTTLSMRNAAFFSYPIFSLFHLSFHITVREILLSDFPKEAEEPLPWLMYIDRNILELFFAIYQN